MGLTGDGIPTTKPKLWYYYLPDSVYAGVPTKFSFQPTLPPFWGANWKTVDERRIPYDISLTASLAAGAKFREKAEKEVFRLSRDIVEGVLAQQFEWQPFVDVPQEKCWHILQVDPNESWRTAFRPDLEVGKMRCIICGLLGEEFNLGQHE